MDENGERLRLARIAIRNDRLENLTVTVGIGSYSVLEAGRNASFDCVGFASQIIEIRLGANGVAISAVRPASTALRLFEQSTSTLKRISGRDAAYKTLWFLVRNDRTDGTIILCEPQGEIQQLNASASLWVGFLYGGEPEIQTSFQERGIVLWSRIPNVMGLFELQIAMSDVALDAL